jgi:hypothetical protein
LLDESTLYFGFNPRQCFEAALSVQMMLRTKTDVVGEIYQVADQGFDKIPPLINVVRLGGGGQNDPPSKVFQIYPDPDDKERLLANCHVSITSWALRHLMGRVEDHKGEKALNLYHSISRMPEAASLRGSLFEMQVLRYLDHLTTEKTFKIRRLTNSYSDETEWKYPGPTKHVDFELSTASGLFEQAISDELAYHLVPSARNFTAVDSIIYDPNDTVLTCIQITINTCHPIVVSGLRNIQSWLKPSTTSAFLRPLRTKPWRFLFVVPVSMESNFEPQTFKGDTNRGEWAGKVDQYVLGLREDTIFRISRNRES